MLHILVDHLGDELFHPLQTLPCLNLGNQRFDFSNRCRIPRQVGYGTECAPAPADKERAVLGRPKAVVGVPFGPEANVEGAALFTYSETDPSVDPGDLEFLSTMAQQVAIALENARLYHLAIEDPATRTYVHSHFLSRLREETDRAVITTRSFSARP